VEKQIEVGDLGITIVAEIPVAQTMNLVKTWQNIPEWATTLFSTPQCPGKLWFYVANEYIDWAHFRQHSVYRPIDSENNWRESC